MDPQKYLNNPYEQERILRSNLGPDFEHRLRRSKTQLLCAKIECILLRGAIVRLFSSVQNDLRGLGGAFIHLQSVSNLREIDQSPVEYSIPLSEHESLKLAYDQLRNENHYLIDQLKLHQKKKPLLPLADDRSFRGEESPPPFSSNRFEIGSNLNQQQPSDCFYHKFRISSNFTGLCIGKNGMLVKQLERLLNCSIHVEEKREEISQRWFEVRSINEGIGHVVEMYYRGKIASEIDRDQRREREELEMRLKDLQTQLNNCNDQLFSYQNQIGELKRKKAIQEEPSSQKRKMSPDTSNTRSFNELSKHCSHENYDQQEEFLFDAQEKRKKLESKLL